MTAKYPIQKDFEPGRGSSREDWYAIDSPELTEEELARMRPAKDVLPKAFFDGIDAARRGHERPKLEAAKIAVTLRVEPDVLEKFKHAETNRGIPLAEAMQQSLHKSVTQAASYYNTAERKNGRAARLIV